jgi:hypothetical protein
MCEEIIKQRKRIRLPAASTVKREIDELTDGLALAPA